jgi:hypothetical protein
LQWYYVTYNVKFNEGGIHYFINRKDGFIPMAREIDSVPCDASFALGAGVSFKFKMDYMLHNLM